MDKLDVRTLRLDAVFNCERYNHKHRWRYRLQVLGSVLVWAFRASATRVIHDPALDSPLLYFAADGTAVESEFPQPINEVRENLRTTLFLNAYDGHPMIRPFRMFLRRRFTADPQLMLEVPDLENEIASVWQMTVGPEITTMVLVGTKRHKTPSSGNYE
jgi:hypothetical protein